MNIKEDNMGLSYTPANDLKATKVSNDNTLLSTGSKQISNTLNHMKQVADNTNRAKLLENYSELTNNLTRVDPDDNEDTIKAKIDKLKEYTNQLANTASKYGLDDIAQTTTLKGDDTVKAYKQELLDKYTTKLANKNIDNMFFTPTGSKYEKEKQILDYANNLKDPEIKGLYLAKVQQMLKPYEPEIKKEKSNEEVKYINSLAKQYKSLPYDEYINKLADNGIDVKKNIGYINTIYNKSNTTNSGNTSNDKQFIKTVDSLSSNPKKILTTTGLEKFEVSFKDLNNNAETVAREIEPIHKDVADNIKTNLNKVKELKIKLNEAIENNDIAHIKDISKQLKESTLQLNNLIKASNKVIKTNYKLKPIKFNGTFNTDDMINNIKYLQASTNDPKEKAKYKHINYLAKTGLISGFNINNIEPNKSLGSSNAYPIIKHTDDVKKALMLYYANNNGSNVNVIKQLAKAKNDSDIYKIVKSDPVFKNVYDSGKLNYDNLIDNVSNIFTPSNTIHKQDDISNKLLNIEDSLNNIKIQGIDVDKFDLSKVNNDMLKDPAKQKYIVNTVINTPNNRRVLNMVSNDKITIDKAFNIFRRAYKDQPNKFKIIAPYIKDVLKSKADIATIKSEASKYKIFNYDNKLGVYYFPLDPDKESNNDKRLVFGKQVYIDRIGKLPSDIDKDDLFNNDDFKQKYLEVFYNKLNKIKPVRKEGYSYNDEIPLNKRTFKLIKNVGYEAFIEALKYYKKNNK